MEKAFEMAILLDTYESLLTKTQVEILRLKLDDDMSLGEIGEMLSISRQAAHNAITKGEEKLVALEGQFRLAYMQRRLRELKEIFIKDNAPQGYIDIIDDITEEG